VGKWFGIGGDDKPAITPPKLKPKPATVAAQKPAPVAPTTKPATVAAVRPPPLRPQAQADQPAQEARASSTSTASLLSGAQPVVPADTFENRWAPAR